MNTLTKVNQVILLIVVLLAVITSKAIYIHETDPQTVENKLLFNLKQELGTPVTAEFLGKRQFNVSNTINTIYTWRNQNTLYEAKLSPNLDPQTYIYELKPEEENVTISPLLAESIAENILQEKIDQVAETTNLTGPTYILEDFRDEENVWRITWGLEIGEYPVLGSEFSVRVFGDQGTAKLFHNGFTDAYGLTAQSPPIITEEEALDIARKSFSNFLEYPVIQSISVRELGITMHGYNMIPANTLIWNIAVSGMGYEKGHMVHTSTVTSIDAHTGENYGGLYVGSGAGWFGGYPYYGSAYPQIYEKYPIGYPYPLNVSQAKQFIYNYSLRGIPDNLAWESIVLQLDEKNTPIIGSFWSRVLGDYKTGTVLPIESLGALMRNEEIINGYVLVIDARTGELITESEFNNIGSPNNTMNITREQAINITQTSNLADPENKIASPDSLVSAEPRIIKPDWVKQLSSSGDYRRIYIANVTQTESRIYWVIRYEKNPQIHGGFTGTYLVDAETGELVFALEDHPLPDLLVKGYAPERIQMNTSETTEFNITVKAASNIEAELPVQIEPVNIPENVSISIQEQVKPLSGEKPAVFNISLKTGKEVLSGVYRIRFDLRFLGRRTGTYMNLEVKSLEGDYVIESRKQEYHIGEVIAFNIISPVPQIGANITIIDPNGEKIWITEPFTEWVNTSKGYAVPYYRQLSDSEPVHLLDKHDLGNWTWVYSYKNTTISGKFTVEEEIEDILKTGPSELGPPDLGGPVSQIIVTREMAEELALDAFKDSLIDPYDVVVNNARRIECEYPEDSGNFTDAWYISVKGKGTEKSSGELVGRTTAYTIIIETGEVLQGVSVGAGITKISYRDVIHAAVSKYYIPIILGLSVVILTHYYRRKRI